MQPFNFDYNAFQYVQFRQYMMQVENATVFKWKTTNYENKSGSFAFTIVFYMFIFNFSSLFHLRWDTTFFFLWNVF